MAFILASLWLVSWIASSMLAAVLFILLLLLARHLKGGELAKQLNWFVLGSALFAIHSAGFSLDAAGIAVAGPLASPLNLLGHTASLGLFLIGSYKMLRFWRPTSTRSERS